MDRDLDAILNTRPTADGRDDEFEALWAQYWEERPKPSAQPLGPIMATGKEAPPSMASTPAKTTVSRRAPKVPAHEFNDRQLPMRENSKRSWKHRHHHPGECTESPGADQLHPGASMRRRFAKR